MIYAKKAAMKIEKREPREPHAGAGMKGKPVPKTLLAERNSPTHHPHLTGEINPKHDKPHVLRNLKGC